MPLSGLRFSGRDRMTEKGSECVRSNKGRNRFLALCIVPATILFFVFMIIPTINVFRMALTDAGAFTAGKFIGLANFVTLFNDKRFIIAMQNTILLVVVVTIITFALALVFAGILTREKIKGQNFFRIVFYIPNILSVVVIAGVFSAIYDARQLPDGTPFGLLNTMIRLFHDPVTWLDERHVIVSIIIAMVWQAIGYYMVMYMASMSAVSASLYESAGLDGAGRITQFFQITLPLIWTNIRTTLTFFIISTINMAFLFVKAMTSGGPNGASDVALSFMYGQKDANLYGYSMAAGVVIFIFSFALSALVNKVTKRDVLEV